MTSALGLTAGAARDVADRGQGGDRGELGAAVGSVARLDAEADRGVGDDRLGADHGEDVAAVRLLLGEDADGARRRGRVRP